MSALGSSVECMRFRRPSTSIANERCPVELANKNPIWNLDLQTRLIQTRFNGLGLDMREFWNNLKLRRFNIYLVHISSHTRSTEYVFINYPGATFFAPSLTYQSKTKLNSRLYIQRKLLQGSSIKEIVLTRIVMKSLLD